MTLTHHTRDTQARRLYAALRLAGYLGEEPETARFARRLGDALWRYGFVAVVLSEEELGLLPEAVAAETQLIGGDSEVDR